MRVSILSDSNWEAKIDHATRRLDERRHFEALSFGTGVTGIAIILNARDPHLGHRRRERFSKAEKCLRFDVMLDLDQLIVSTHQQRRDIICKACLADLSSTLERRGFSDFDSKGFFSEFESMMRKALQGPDAAEFDHLSLERATGT